MDDIADKQESRTGAEYEADVVEANPQGRLLDPSEIGSLALWLCTQEARGMTMQDLTVSAGSLW